MRILIEEKSMNFFLSKKKDPLRYGENYPQKYPDNLLNAKEFFPLQKISTTTNVKIT